MAEKATFLDKDLVAFNSILPLQVEVVAFLSIAEFTSRGMAEMGDGDSLPLAPINS
jgi:hypothetical protein